ncbi:MAG: glycosyltransferase family A protein [Geminicoccaceae bacterium]|nr:glycosyltransferase family A protein [Geminicoccaceae bacterium]
MEPEGPLAAPRISVVVAVHDLEEYIAQTIESVLAQTMAAFELIVVVDSSSDGTAASAKGYLGDRRVRIIEAAAGGAGAARNIGLDAAGAPLILFLDGDDLLAPDALDAFVAGFEAAPEAVAVVAGHDKIDEQGRPIPGEEAASRPGFPSTADPLRTLLERNLITNGGTICLRTEAARTIGGYDPRLKVREDWDFWCRLACRGGFVSLGQRSTLLYRQRRIRTTTYTPALAPPPPAIAKVYALPDVKRQFAQQELEAMRRRTVIDHFWASARLALYRGERLRFAHYLLVGIARYPDSLMQGFLLRFLARQVASRLRPGPSDRRQVTG